AASPDPRIQVPQSGRSRPRPRSSGLNAEPTGVRKRWDIAETNELGASLYYKYDAIGRLTQKFDRNGRLTVYSYDIYRELDKEEWFTYTTPPTFPADLATWKTTNP
ncbi:MAG: RHS repeat domain-containing protein, partial [Planctomycetota bacterium]